MGLGIDPDKAKAFCNLVLRQGVQENQDFIIVPIPAGRLLLMWYGGICVKRLVLSLQDDTNSTYVEIHPMSIRFIVVPNKSHNPTDHCIYTTHICKNETLLNLKTKICRILSAKISSRPNSSYEISINNCKLWKCEDANNLKQIIRSYEHRDNSLVYISAKLLRSSSTPLDVKYLFFHIDKNKNNLTNFNLSIFKCFILLILQYFFRKLKLQNLM